MAEEQVFSFFHFFHHTAKKESGSSLGMGKIKELGERAKEPEKRHKLQSLLCARKSGSARFFLSHLRTSKEKQPKMRGRGINIHGVTRVQRTPRVPITGQSFVFHYGGSRLCTLYSRVRLTRCGPSRLVARPRCTMPVLYYCIHNIQ